MLLWGHSSLKAPYYVHHYRDIERPRDQHLECTMDQLALNVLWRSDKPKPGLLNKKTWDQKNVAAWSQKQNKKGKRCILGEYLRSVPLKVVNCQRATPTASTKVEPLFRGITCLTNQVTIFAIFAEMSSSPASMEAAKILDAQGSQACHSKKQADARQAYTRAIFTGIPTLLRLPRNRWPKDWQRLSLQRSFST